MIPLNIQEAYTFVRDFSSYCERSREAFVLKCYQSTRCRKVRSYDEMNKVLRTRYPEQWEVWSAEAKELTRRWKDAYAQAQGLVFEYANSGEFFAALDTLHTDELQLVHEVDSGSWHTQGFGAHKYAKGSLLPPKIVLEFLGFRTDIRLGASYTIDQLISYYGHTRKLTYSMYQLWADCDLMVYDIATRYYITPESCDPVPAMRSMALNPKVYYPFLKDSE